MHLQRHALCQASFSARLVAIEYQGAIVNPTERVVVGYGIRLHCHAPGIQRTCVIADCTQQYLDWQRRENKPLIWVITWRGTVMNFRLLYAEWRWTEGGIFNWRGTVVYHPARMPGK